MKLRQFSVSPCTPTSSSCLSMNSCTAQQKMTTVGRPGRFSVGRIHSLSCNLYMLTLLVNLYSSLVTASNFEFIQRHSLSVLLYCYPSLLLIGFWLLQRFAGYSAGVSNIRPRARHFYPAREALAISSKFNRS